MTFELQLQNELQFLILESTLERVKDKYNRLASLSVFHH